MCIYINICIYICVYGANSSIVECERAWTHRNGETKGGVEGYLAHEKQPPPP